MKTSQKKRKEKKKFFKLREIQIFKKQDFRAEKQKNSTMWDKWKNK